MPLSMSGFRDGGMASLTQWTRIARQTGSMKDGEAGIFTRPCELLLSKEQYHWVAEWWSSCDRVKLLSAYQDLRQSVDFAGIITALKEQSRRQWYSEIIMLCLMGNSTGLEYLGMRLYFWSKAIPRMFLADLYLIKLQTLKQLKAIHG